jgi:hypothetical protein
MRLARIVAVLLEGGRPDQSAKLVLVGPVDDVGNAMDGEWLGDSVINDKRVPFYGRPDGRSLQLATHDEGGLANLNIAGKALKAGSTFSFFGARSHLGQSEAVFRVESVST